MTSHCLRAIYRIEREEGGPARARAIIDWELRDRVSLPVLEELELMISELVTGGLDGAERSAEITLDLRLEEIVRCSVLTPRTSVGEVDGRGGGWGLNAVAWLADRWGITQVGGTTRVWFEKSAR
jgi:hypothetical protein